MQELLRRILSMPGSLSTLVNDAGVSFSSLDLHKIQRINSELLSTFQKTKAYLNAATFDGSTTVEAVARLLGKVKPAELCEVSLPALLDYVFLLHSALGSDNERVKRQIGWSWHFIRSDFTRLKGNIQLGCSSISYIAHVIVKLCNNAYSMSYHCALYQQTVARQGSYARLVP